MRKILFALILFLILQILLISPKPIDAKIWDKNLIDKAILTTGFSGSICPIKDDPVVIEKVVSYSNAQEIDYNLAESEADCTENKQGILFGKVALDFKETDSLGEEYIFIFEDTLLRADSIGWDYFDDLSIGAQSVPNDKGEIKRGLKSIKSSTLYRTDINLPNLQEEIPNSGFLIVYGTDGEIAKTLFIYKGSAYLVSSIGKTVNDKILIDYRTEANKSATISDVSIKNELFSGEFYSFEYPKDWKIDKSEKEKVNLQKQEKIASSGPYEAEILKTTLTIYSTEVDTETTLEKWFEMRYFRGDDTSQFEAMKNWSKKTTLGGIEALSVRVPGGGGYIDEGMVSINKGRGYDISIIGNLVKGSNEAYQTVLSTFKF